MTNQEHKAAEYLQKLAPRTDAECAQATQALYGDDELIRREFMRRFSLWDIPVDKLDMRLQDLPREERQSHYLSVKNIVADPAFRREIDDWLRRVSSTLAMGVYNGVELTETQKQALRIMMLEIRNFHDTLEKRGMLLAGHTPLSPMADRI